jgi:N-formylglutamate amidohydrolase
VLFPDGVVLHIPHNSTEIPYAAPFYIDQQELKQELIKMTDHKTLWLFRGPRANIPVIAAEVSRLVVDVERFADDELEVMAQYGMGVIYTATSDRQCLREPVGEKQRNRQLELYYQPHHQRFTQAVNDCLNRNNRCLIIDGHSFPSIPLPYELDQELSRPMICLGTDEFHTSPAVSQAFIRSFEDAGFTVSVNRPFSGAIVPQEHYRSDPRVASIMIEINRNLYIDESTGWLLDGAEFVAERIRNATIQASKQALATFSH